MTIPATMLTFPSPVVGTPDTELRNIVRGNDNVLRGRVNDLITHAATVVVGPATATDNAVALFDGTTGKLIKNSPVLVVGGAVSGITSLTTTGNATLGDATSDVHTVTGVPTFNIGSGLFRINNGATVEFELNGATGQVGIGAAAQTDVGVLLDTVARNITANTEYDRLYVKATGALTVINASVSSIITTARFDEPKIVLAGTGAVTTAATVYVADAPTEATNNYALLVASGATGLQALTATTAAFTSASATTFTGALVGNASSATILATARTIWGQSFNGSADVSGALSGATTGAFSSNVTVGGTLGVTGAATLSSTLALTGAITWSGDTNLYRASANVLATDDALVVTGIVTGNAVGGALSLSGATLSNRRIDISNTGGSANIGVESSTGGAIITGSTAYATVINTGNTTPIQFGVNSAVVMTLLNGGNVGIGTSAPSAKLHVLYNNVAAYGDGIKVQNTNAAGYAVLTMQAETTGFPILEFNRGGTPQWQVFNNPSDDSLDFFKFGYGSLIKLMPNGNIITGAGNVGIGVTPSSKLDVNGEIRGRGNVLAYSQYSLQRLSGALELAVLKYWNGTGSPLSAGNQGDMVVIGNAGGDGLIFVNSNLERMRIDASGNVGIGTSSPASTLTIGTNNSVNRAIEVRYSSVPLYLSGGFDGTRTTNQMSTNVKDTSNGSLTTTLLENTLYGGLAYRQASATGSASYHSWSYYAPTAGTPTQTELMRIDASGNVGIGVTPATKLHVYEAGAVELRVEGVTGAKPVVGVRIKSDTTSDFTLRTLGTNEVQLYDNANARIQFAVKHTVAAGETSLFLYDVDNATLERVTVGAADSGGAGFKVLRIPN